MRKIRFLMIAVTLFFLPNAICLASEPDAAGSKDPSIFSRMPGFHIYSYEALDFGRYEFPVGPGKMQAVEGRQYFVVYYANAGIKIPSGLQVTRNYLNAAKTLGGKSVYEFEDGGTQYVTLKIPQKGTEIWAEVSGANNGMYNVKVIEKQLMNQDVIANAAVLTNDIKTTGHVAVYGIYFDTGKSVLKPESDVSLIEIAKVLNSDPGLKLNVVGHTDNAGMMDSNMKLSQARAEAVAQALVAKHGISATRLKGYGVASLAPLATNDTEAGRAKNRRVELVKQ